MVEKVDQAMMKLIHFLEKVGIQLCQAPIEMAHDVTCHVFFSSIISVA